jgi:cobalamin biosynthesis protein CobD/CbiB
MDALVSFVTGDDKPKSAKPDFEHDPNAVKAIQQWNAHRVKQGKTEPSFSTRFWGGSFFLIMVFGISLNLFFNNNVAQWVIAIVAFVWAILLVCMFFLMLDYYKIYSMATQNIPTYGNTPEEARTLLSRVPYSDGL